MVQFVVPLLVTMFGFAACASAEIYYPWCANYRSPGGSNCGFSTHEQCMATVNGIAAPAIQIRGIRPLRKIHLGTNTEPAYPCWAAIYNKLRTPSGN